MSGQPTPRLRKMPSERSQQAQVRPVTGHQKRWLTVAVTLPILILVILKGGRVSFAVLIGLGTSVSLLEYYALVLPEEARFARGIGLILGLAVFGSFYVQDFNATCGMLVLSFFVSAIMCLVLFGSRGFTADVLSRYLLGFVYVPFLAGHLILIRNSHEGMIWTSFVLFAVFASDTAAYYVGKAIGRHKLCPSISPGKTVEGAAGGLAGNLLIGALFKQLWLPELSWGFCIVLLLVVGVATQVGDLVESMLKRSVGSKHSGWFMPGHGGMLDRVDGLFFAAPVFYYFRTYLL